MNPFPQEAHFDNAGMHNGRRRIMLTRNLVAITSFGIITIPRGFISDGGSIPKLAYSIVGTGLDDALEDFILHDYLYSSLNDEYSRGEADFLLGETTWNRGINPFKRHAFLVAVKLFGGKHFKGSAPKL